MQEPGGLLPRHLLDRACRPCSSGRKSRAIESGVVLSGLQQSEVHQRQCRRPGQWSTSIALSPSAGSLGRSLQLERRLHSHHRSDSDRKSDSGKVGSEPTRCRQPAPTLVDREPAPSRKRALRRPSAAEPSSEVSCPAIGSVKPGARRLLRPARPCGRGAFAPLQRRLLGGVRGASEPGDPPGAETDCLVSENKTLVHSRRNYDCCWTAKLVKLDQPWSCRTKWRLSVTITRQPGVQNTRARSQLARTNSWERSRRLGRHDVRCMSGLMQISLGEEK